LWAAKYGIPYVRTSPAAEAKAAKMLVDEPPERVTRWLQRYLASDKPFYVERRHPFLLFAHTINEHRAKVSAARHRDGSEAPSAAATEAYLRSLRTGGDSGGR